MFIVQCLGCSVQRNAWKVQCKVCTVHSAISSFHSLMCSVHNLSCNFQRSLWSVNSALWSVYNIIFSFQSAVHDHGGGSYWMTFVCKQEESISIRPLRQPWQPLSDLCLQKRGIKQHQATEAAMAATEWPLSANKMNPAASGHWGSHEYVDGRSRSCRSLAPSGLWSILQKGGGWSRKVVSCVPGPAGTGGICNTCRVWN